MKSRSTYITRVRSMGCRGGGGGRRPGATEGGAVTATTCESWWVSRVRA
ncbi:MAG: hypothetical protein IPF99_24530 [Deltaproteobacteria bacterium]|nr:hypothetical protein [Deltaproteobacteria bacterium]